MTRILTARMADALVSGRPRVGLVQMGHPAGTFFGWTGIGPKDYGGNTYTGMGVLGRVSPIQNSSDLAVQDIVFELNGVDPESLARLSGSVKGYTGTLWLACLDEYENIIADPYLLVESELDVQDFEAAADGTCSIKITGHNGFWQFERQLNEVWSTENQKTLYPDDTGLDLLSTLRKPRHRMDGDVRDALAAAVLDQMRAVGPEVVWGVDDCVLFAADPIKRVLGYDPVADWRGTYDSRETAQEAIGDLGLAYAFRAVAKRWGWKRIDPSAALAGDPGLLSLPAPDGKRVLTTAICRAPGWFVMRSNTGYVALRSSRIRLAWSVL